VIKPRKRFGQNFLQDQNIIHSIVAAIHPKFQDILIEIGPGRGALTLPVLKKVQKLKAIEIDRDLSAYWKAQTLPGLELIEADALTLDFSHFLENDNRKMRIFGNLPYNVATPLLFHLIQFADKIEDIHFMVQKEVADRITAASGCKDYGRLSVMMQYYFKVSFLLSVGPEVFYPKPKVDSSVIRLIPHAVSPYSAVEKGQLEKTVKLAFEHRRKTLKNNFGGLLAEEDWRKLGIDSRQRAETLSVENFVAISLYMV